MSPHKMRQMHWAIAGPSENKFVTGLLSPAERPTSALPMMPETKSLQCALRR